MITQLLISFVFGIINVLINLIPTITLPTGFLSAMTDVSFFMAQIAYVIPVNTLLLCLSVVFVLHNAKFIVSIFNFIVRKIPGIN